MVVLYGLAPEVRIFFSALLTIAIIMQTLRLFLLVSHKEYRIPQSVLFHEVLILFHLILATMMLSIPLLHRNFIAGYFYGVRFIEVVIFIPGVWILLKHRNPEPFLTSFLLIATLPFWTFTYSKYIFLIANLCIFFRCVVMLDIEWRRIRESITRLSIKEAVDLFPGGILYSNEKGRMLIVNPAMNRLFSALDINSETDAISLWESLLSTQDSYNRSVQALDDKLLIRIRNGGSWLFSNQIIHVNKKRYMQILAIDITDEDVLTREMEESNNALKELGYELSLSIKNIDQLEKEREILRMKIRVHDILGQRLSILSRLLESDMDAEDIIYNFKPLLTDLTQAITETIDTTPQYLLSSLTHAFELIGTAIHLKGSLPEVGKVAKVFAEVIREYATNAVRHADAGNVYAEFKENSDEYILSVHNDGTPPAETIVEGGGITGIRRQVCELAGEINISLRPRFHIHIRVPKNRKDDIYD